LLVGVKITDDSSIHVLFSKLARIWKKAVDIFEMPFLHLFEETMKEHTNFRKLSRSTGCNFASGFYQICGTVGNHSRHTFL
jgi:hypothetical protein